MIWVIGIVLILLFLLFTWAILDAASEADDRMEEQERRFRDGE